MRHMLERREEIDNQVTRKSVVSLSFQHKNGPLTHPTLEPYQTETLVTLHFFTSFQNHFGLKGDEFH